MGNPVKMTGLSTGGVEDIMSFTPELTELLNICIAEHALYYLQARLLHVLASLKPTVVCTQGAPMPSHAHSSSSVVY